MPKTVAVAFIKSKQLWRKACNHDHIPIGSKFAVFSDDNPFLQEYYQEMSFVLEYLNRP